MLPLPHDYATLVYISSFPLSLFLSQLSFSSPSACLSPPSWKSRAEWRERQNWYQVGLDAEKKQRYTLIHFINLKLKFLVAEKQIAEILYR